MLAAALGYGVTAAGLGAAFGFSPHALGAYLRGAAAVSGGYSVGMALRGPRIEIALALAVGAAIIVLALAALRERKPEPALLGLVVIFLAWKHGFVRQDAHILYFFFTAAAVAPLLGITLRRNAAALAGVAATAFALAALLWAQSRTLHAIPGFFEPARIVHGGAYLLDPRGTATRLAAGLDAALAPDRLPRDVAARIGSATVDVLPWETAIVRASGLHWAPLPVFQAYSAYTPLLDGLNRDALAEHGAAYYLYRYLAIDGRFPFGEAPATTTELLCRYAVAAPRVTTAAATGTTRERRLRAAAARRCCPMRRRTGRTRRRPRAGRPDRDTAGRIARRVRSRRVRPAPDAGEQGPHGAVARSGDVRVGPLRRRFDADVARDRGDPAGRRGRLGVPA